MSFLSRNKIYAGTDTGTPFTDDDAVASNNIVPSGKGFGFIISNIINATVTRSSWLRSVLYQIMKSYQHKIEDRTPASFLGVANEATNTLYVAPEQLPITTSLVNDFTVSTVPSDGNLISSQQTVQIVPSYLGTQVVYKANLASSFVKFLIARTTPSSNLPLFYCHAKNVNNIGQNLGDGSVNNPFGTLDSLLVKIDSDITIKNYTIILLGGTFNTAHNIYRGCSFYGFPGVVINYTGTDYLLSQKIPGSTNEDTNANRKYIGNWYFSGDISVNIINGGAILSAIIDVSGNITNFTITSGGYGYLTPPTITVAGGSGQTFIASLDFNGTITSIAITGTGVNYNNSVTVTNSSGSNIGGGFSDLGSYYTGITPAQSLIPNIGKSQKWIYNFSDLNILAGVYSQTGTGDTLRNFPIFKIYGWGNTYTIKLLSLSQTMSNVSIFEAKASNHDSFTSSANEPNSGVNLSFEFKTVTLNFNSQFLTTGVNDLDFFGRGLNIKGNDFNLGGTYSSLVNFKFFNGKINRARYSIFNLSIDFFNFATNAGGTDLIAIFQKTGNNYTGSFNCVFLFNNTVFRNNKSGSNGYDIKTVFIGSLISEVLVSFRSCLLALQTSSDSIFTTLSGGVENGYTYEGSLLDRSDLLTLPSSTTFPNTNQKLVTRNSLWITPYNI